MAFKVRNICSETLLKSPHQGCAENDFSLTITPSGQSQLLKAPKANLYHFILVCITSDLALATDKK